MNKPVSINSAVISALNNRREHEEQNRLDPLCAQLVDKVFIKMALLCRGFDNLFADRNRLNAEKTQWILAFTKNRLRSQSQIQKALNKLEHHKYPNPPQLGEFLDWLKHDCEELGFPSVDEAFQISLILNRQFSEYTHPDKRIDTVIRHTIGQINANIYRGMQIYKAKSTFEHYYMVSIRQFIEGSLKDIHAAIACDKEDITSSEQKKRKDITKGFEQCTNYSAARKAMKAILGVGYK